METDDIDVVRVDTGWLVKSGERTLKLFSDRDIDSFLRAFELAWDRAIEADATAWLVQGERRARINFGND